jgi:hypothetical protein
MCSALAAASANFYRSTEAKLWPCGNSFVGRPSVLLDFFSLVGLMQPRTIAPIDYSTIFIVSYGCYGDANACRHRVDMK